MIISGTTIQNTTIQDQILAALYPFSNFIFTTANNVGRFGPNLSTLLSWYSGNSVYSGNTWINDTNYYSQTTQGIQLWTVPATGTYTITAAGARAGARASANTNITAGYGDGAVIQSSNISLTQGQKLQILVGQEGLSYSTNGSGGGGGGTFVVLYTGNPTVASDAIIVAGGGGSMNQIGANAAAYAGSPYFTANSNANLYSTSGNRSSTATTSSTGGINGNGGGSVSWAAGGGGLLGNSTAPAAGSIANREGIAFKFGGNGGNANYTNIAQVGGASVGGFGGGGGTHGFTGGGGGGGGYSGGGGGQQTNQWDMGGGGGSYCIDSNYTIVGFNHGAGYVIITKN